MALLPSHIEISFEKVSEELLLRLSEFDAKVDILERRITELEAIHKPLQRRLTISQAIRKFNVSRRTLQRHIASGRLKNMSETGVKTILESDAIGLYGLR